MRELNQTTFRIDGMDCPSEERMIRMTLEGVEGIARLEFDLSARTLDVYHEGPPHDVAKRLEPLNLGARQTAHRVAVPLPSLAGEEMNRGPLRWALAINLTLFFGEVVAGILAGSMGLLADALDMLADSLVYALSLAAVGGSALRKRRLAASSGYLQAGLALVGLAEVTRRFVVQSEIPEVGPMIGISLLALGANVATLVILRRTTRGEAHIEASWIFTSNDIKVNALVIVAALFVWWSGSAVPDLVAGALIFLVVASGARRILSLSNPRTRDG